MCLEEKDLDEVSMIPTMRSLCWGMEAAWGGWRSFWAMLWPIPSWADGPEHQPEGPPATESSFFTPGESRIKRDDGKGWLQCPDRHPLKEAEVSVLYLFWYIVTFISADAAP